MKSQAVFIIHMMQRRFGKNRPKSPALFAASFVHKVKSIHFIDLRSHLLQREFDSALLQTPSFNVFVLGTKTTSKLFLIFSEYAQIMQILRRYKLFISDCKQRFVR